jgi:hypothetical protein
MRRKIMKSLLICIFVLALSGLIFFGCNQQEATNALPESSNSPTGNMSFNKNAVIESMTGSGHYRTASGLLRTFSMNARKYQNGTIRGEYQYYNRGGELREHGKITCFTINGNSGWIAGYMEKIARQGGGYIKVDPYDRVWRVVDNGEGKNAPPDQISVILSPGESPIPGEPPLPDSTITSAGQYCDETPNIPSLHNIEGGNIQVH